MRKSHLLIPHLASAVVIIALAAVYPVNTDFSAANPGWNGLTVFTQETGAVEGSLATLAALYDPRNYTLFIIGPSESFSPQEAAAVRSFLAKGGTVVIMDDFGTANQLLSLLEVPARFSGGLLLDPLLNQGHPALPVAYWGGSRLVLNYATTIDLLAQRGARVIATSSHFSYIDLNLNNRYDEGEPAGPFPVAVELSFGPGKLVLVSDPSLLINAMIHRGQNAQFALYLAAGRTPAVDSSHWEENLHAEVKSLLAKAWLVASSPEVKYSLAASLAIAVLALGETHFKRG
uniref:DUF4350 domain-containing protein n=1 Tax=Thermofilum pendens TaxID=2269 RepID=A0A7J3X5R8_THEPE